LIETRRSSIRTTAAVRRVGKGGRDMSILARQMSRRAHAVRLLPGAGSVGTAALSVVVPRKVRGRLCPPCVRFPLIEICS